MAKQTVNQAWLLQLLSNLNLAGQSIEQLEEFLSKINEEINEFSSESLTDIVKEHPKLSQEIYLGYQKLITQIKELKKTTLQEMQQVQKSTVLVNSYMQKEESANFIDRQF